MGNKATLIVCASVHHKNTIKIANAISDILEADVIEPKDFDIESISRYDLIGFGSGIYNGKHHESILNLVSSINKQNNKKAFIFSTATIPLEVPHKTLNEMLIEKGFDVIGHFCCKGFMDYSFTKYLFRGLNKGRPNNKDFERARQFAMKIKQTLQCNE